MQYSNTRAIQGKDPFELRTPKAGFKASTICTRNGVRQCRTLHFPMLSIRFGSVSMPVTPEFNVLSGEILYLAGQTKKILD